MSTDRKTKLSASPASPSSTAPQAATDDKCDCDICHGNGYVGSDYETCACIKAGCRKRHTRDAHLPRNGLRAAPQAAGDGETITMPQPAAGPMIRNVLPAVEATPFVVAAGETEPQPQGMDRLSELQQKWGKSIEQSQRDGSRDGSRVGATVFAASAPSQGQAAERFDPALGITYGLTEGGTATDGDILTRLGDDASKWAAEFVKVAAKIGHPGLDEGWVLGWFANAIEHSTDVRSGRMRAPAGVVGVAGGVPDTTRVALSAAARDGAHVNLSPDEVKAIDEALRNLQPDPPPPGCTCQLSYVVDVACPVHNRSALSPRPDDGTGARVDLAKLAAEIRALPNCFHKAEPYTNSHNAYAIALEDAAALVAALGAEQAAKGGER